MTKCGLVSRGEPQGLLQVLEPNDVTGGRQAPPHAFKRLVDALEHVPIEPDDGEGGVAGRARIGGRTRRPTWVECGGGGQTAHLAGWPTLFEKWAHPLGTNLGGLYPM